MAKRLVPTDFLPYNIHAVSTDGAYAYARKVGQNASKIYTLRTSNWSEISSFDWASLNGTNDLYGSVQDCFTVSSGAVFCCILRQYDPASPGSLVALNAYGDNGYNSYGELWRSVDLGVTWTRVLFLGDVNGAAASFIPGVISVGNAHGNLCEDTKRKALYFGEYNVSEDAPYSMGRTAGGKYDGVRLMKSTNDGATWTAVMTWNTNGTTNQIRHIHAVQFNPYNNHIILAIGDSNAQCGTIDWNPDTGTWANNVALSAQAGTGFNVVYGKQNTRGVKVAITPNYLIWYTDATSTDDATGLYRGIMRARHDLTDLRRVNADLAANTTISGWDALCLSDGSVITGTQPGAGADDTDAYIWASEGTDLTKFTKIARIGGRQTSTGPFMQFFELRGTVLVSHVAVAGQNASTAATSAGWGTIVCRYGDTFMSDAPEAIAPVRWVNTATGSDSNTGERPTLAYATLGKALTASQITYGTRVIFSGQQAPTAGVTCAWGSWAGFYVGKTGAEVQVTGTTAPGCGPTALVDSYIATNAASELIRCDAASHNIRTKNLILDALSASANMLVTALTVTANNWAIEDCRIGDNFTGNVAWRARNAGGVYKALRTKFNQGALTSGKSAITTDGTAVVTLNACVLTGSYRAIEVIAGSPVVTVENCYLTGYADSGVCADAATTPALSLRGNEFAGGGNPPIRDLATLTWTDDKTNRNFADVQTAPSGKLGTLSTIGGTTQRASDYTLPSTSPCVQAAGNTGGSLAAPLFDLYGNRFKNPSSVGPCEYASGQRAVASRISR